MPPSYGLRTKKGISGYSGFFRYISCIFISFSTKQSAYVALYYTLCSSTATFFHFLSTLSVPAFSLIRAMLLISNNIAFSWCTFSRLRCTNTVFALLLSNANQRAQGLQKKQINKLTSVFNASVPLLIMNFVITLSKPQTKLTIL